MHAVSNTYVGADKKKIEGRNVENRPNLVVRSVNTYTCNNCTTMMCLLDWKRALFCVYRLSKDNILSSESQFLKR